MRVTACQSVLEVGRRSPTLGEITKKGNVSIHISVFLEACCFELEKEKYMHIV